MLWRVGTILSLFGAIAIALLPAGLLPRKAGPCGKELCLCKPELKIEVPKNTEEGTSCTCKKPPEPRWVWVKSAKFDTSSEALVYSSIFANFDIPLRFELISDDFITKLVTFEFASSAYDSRAIPIDSPPPKSIS